MSDREKNGPTPKQIERKKRQMLRRMRGLKNKKYPKNRYEVKTVGNLSIIKRVEGTRPHKKKGERKVSKNG